MYEDKLKKALLKKIKKIRELEQKTPTKNKETVNKELIQKTLDF